MCVSQSDGGCCCFSSRPLWLWVPQGCSVWLGRGASLLIPCPAAPLGLLRADSETTGLFVACQTCGLQVPAMISVHPCHVLEAGCLSNKCTESVGLGCVLLAGRVWSTLPLDILLFQEDFFVHFLSIVPFLLFVPHRRYGAACQIVRIEGGVSKSDFDVPPGHATGHGLPAPGSGCRSCPCSPCLCLLQVNASSLPTVALGMTVKMRMMRSMELKQSATAE